MRFAEAIRKRREIVLAHSTSVLNQLAVNYPSAKAVGLLASTIDS